MEALYGVSPDDGISMWVADMEFAVAPCIQKAVQNYQTGLKTLSKTFAIPTAENIKSTIVKGYPAYKTISDSRRYYNQRQKKHGVIPAFKFYPNLLLVQKIFPYI